MARRLGCDGQRRSPADLADGHTTSGTAAGVDGVSRRRSLLAGGTEGNERLTVLTGLLLIVLFAALGITIIRIGQLLWLHLFLGLLLLGPVALKLSSTGYRFARYYTSDPVYREKGPPGPGATWPRSARRLLHARGLRHRRRVTRAGTQLPSAAGAAAQSQLLRMDRRHRPARARTPTRNPAAPVNRAPLTTRDHGGPRGIGTRSPATVPREYTHRRSSRARGVALVTALLSGLVLAVALTGQFSVWTHGHPGPGRPPLHASPSTRAETRP